MTQRAGWLREMSDDVLIDVLPGWKPMHETIQPLFRSIPRSCGILVLAFWGFAPHEASAQVRMKTPDRGTYQSPVLPAKPASTADAKIVKANSGIASLVRESSPGIADLVRRSESGVTRSNQATPAQAAPADDRNYADKARRLPLMDVSVENKSQPINPMRQPSGRPSIPAAASNVRRQTAGAPSGGQSPLQPVSHQEEVVLLPPQVDRVDESPAEIVLEPPIRLHRDRVVSHPIPRQAADAPTETVQPNETVYDEPTPMAEPLPHMHAAEPLQPMYVPHAGSVHGCDGCPSCEAGMMGCDAMGCDAMGCDSYGCDTMGCDSIGPCFPGHRRWSNASLSLRPERWFGGAELLLLWRRRDRMPPLVSTGALDDATTDILFPTNTLYQDMSVGGRFTVGTWLDPRQCRSLVLRGWFAGEDTVSFSVNQADVPVFGRPFLNVTGVPTQTTLLIAGANRQDGSLSLTGSSDVYGADIALRQYWYGKYGATVDFLYGYQYMRLDEDLNISSSSFNVPLGATQAVQDSFDVANEFHGGQIGLATRYRECCWSFNALAKVGFGSLSRRSRLSGSTTTTVVPPGVVDPNGLLVRSTNAGSFTDHTFGWVPEIDLSIGYQFWQCCEATFGYNIIAMTDAVRVSDVIDPELAVNLDANTPPVGPQRPAINRSDSTFYIQGIHFALQYVY